MIKARLLRVFLPPLVAVLSFSFALIAVIHFSDVGKSDFYFEGMIAMTLFFIAFGYPVAFVANLIGIVFIKILKDNRSYNLYTLLIASVSIGVIVIVITTEVGIEKEFYPIIFAVGLGGICASLCYHFLDKNYSNLKLHDQEKHSKS